MKRFRTALVGAAATVALLSGCSVDGSAIKAAGSESTETSTDLFPSQPTPTSSPSGAPITADGAFRISESDNARVVVTIIEDLACPACKAFEGAYRETLGTIANLPGAAVDYRIISFLDRMSSDDYSSRAANASHCVWNRPGDNTARQDTWLKFHESLFTKQPSEGGRGLPDADLIALAKAAGANGVADCITSKRYAAEVAETTSNTMDQPGFSGTPTVMLNGQDVDIRSVSTLLEQVEKLLPR
ncbi:DsbA family protein [Gordonia sp. (in: high G+C Gram-positive bacteria)]|uniref:DsbA family protein n=1 Tax=Gordonia sp. (in: high G+C Gram-positive bacteria) TaxID=84139 RepID=UPI003C78DB31